MHHTLIRLLALTLTLGWLGCGEEPELHDATPDETPELTTLQQALNMDLGMIWHDNQTLMVTFKFESVSPGNGNFRICSRAGGSGSWGPCNTVTPMASQFVCDWAGVCTAVYFVSAQGACGDVQEVRVQEGKAPFYRETRTVTLGPCTHGGTFWPAGGGHKAGCNVSPSAPSGTNGFTWANHFYHTLTSSGSCPLPGSTFDGVNCKVMPIPRNEGFVRWPGYFLYRPYNCPAP